MSQPKKPGRPAYVRDPDFAAKLAEFVEAQPDATPPARSKFPPKGVDTRPRPELPSYPAKVSQPNRVGTFKQANLPLKPLRAQLKKKYTKIGAANLRVVEAAVEIIQNPDKFAISYQHSVLCQTCLPYRDPGADVLSWERDNGFVSLSLEAGRAFHPSGKWVRMGLPYGPKPRQILAYLNTEAILQQKPVIDVERSLSSFIRLMGYDHKGQNFTVLKNQIARLAAADFRLGVRRDDNSADTHKGSIVSAFNLWCEKDDRQRILWPRTIQLDERYFSSLVDHAVPLDSRAIAALGHSAMALDIYAWLAQRLHRVNPTAPTVITWAALHHQFGEGFARVRKFREKFLVALRAVKAVYPDAKFGLDQVGLVLHHSRPPVLKRILAAPALITPEAAAK